MTFHTPADATAGLTKHERSAFDRVRRAGVRCDPWRIVAWIRCCGPESILRASLNEIRAVANAF